MIDVSLLKQICEIPGAPGFEKPVRDLVISLVTPWVDEVRVDNIGNVIALKKGTRNPDGKRVMLAAHLDEIGFIVSHIDEQGFLRFNTLGGFDPKNTHRSASDRTWQKRPDRGDGQQAHSRDDGRGENKTPQDH